MYINGKWIESGASFDVINPSTGNVYRTVNTGGKIETEQAVIAAKSSFEQWSKVSAYKRAEYVEEIAIKIKENHERLAKVISSEMGKPIKNARGEVSKSIDYFKWFSEEAKRVYGETIASAQSNKRLMSIKQPVGVVAAITPWNFPLSMIARKLAAALAAGCTFILKPSSQAPVSAIELFKLIDSIGVPEGVVNLVIGSANEISQVLLDSKDVRKLTFTGSTFIGKKLLEQSANTVKKVSLELGGHAPFIVFPDADLDLAVNDAITIKFSSAGQQCVCANRIYIHNDVYDEFKMKFVKRVQELKVTDGLVDDCDVGPLINEQAIDKMQEQVNDAVNKGARVLHGGYRLTKGAYSKGSFYNPTVLEDVTEEMIINYEETFGPIAPLFRFHEEDEVIKKANDSIYGLAAYFFTKDNSRIYRVSEKLEYGVIGVNTAPASEVQGPFGGVKESGLGREGGHGISEYLEDKMIAIKIEESS